MIIDCDTCPVAGEGCPDCVVAFLLDRPPAPVELDAVERRALLRLARAGLVPWLPAAVDTSEREAGEEWTTMQSGSSRSVLEGA